jgi:hypothetical protein
MSSNSRFLLLLVLLAVLSCTKDAVHTNCTDLLPGLISRNDASIKDQLDGLTEDLFPEPDAADALGHEKNLETLIERLNDECSSITASVGCYACIYTLPAQSEIMVSLDSAGITVVRVIDIVTPQDGALQFRSIH